MASAHDAAIQKLAGMAQELHERFFITALAVFDEPAHIKLEDTIYRENFEKNLKHIPGVEYSDEITIDVVIEFPREFFTMKIEEIERTKEMQRKHWNKILSFLELAIGMRVHLFTFKFTYEMKNPVIIFDFYDKSVRKHDDPSDGEQEGRRLVEIAHHKK
nr:hypothetical protein [Candidatus Sigynarchaeota archaeon]